MAEAHPAPTDANASYEALRQVKTAETDWSKRIADAKKDLEATLTRLREESDAAVKAAQVEADQERTNAVQRARDDADREAETILSAGRAEASAATAGAGRRPADQTPKILGAVLGDLAGD